MDDAGWTSPSRTEPYAGLDQLYIAGEWRGGSGKPREDHDPWTGEVLAEIAQAGLDDLEAAYAAAARAQPGWAAALPMQRSEVMSRAAASAGSPSRQRS